MHEFSPDLKVAVIGGTWHVGAILDVGRPGAEIVWAREKNVSRLFPHRFHTRTTFLGCPEPQQACGNDVEYRWSAQLLLTASGGRFTCDTMNPDERQMKT